MMGALDSRSGFPGRAEQGMSFQIGDLDFRKKSGPKKSIPCKTAHLEL